MSILRNLLNIILINSILFFQMAPVYALQTSNLYYDQLIDQPVKKEIFSQLLLKNKAVIVVFDDIILDIPLFALKDDVTLTMEKLFATEELQESMSNVTAGAVAYRFGPDGLEFKSKIKITMPFSPEIAESEAAFSNLYTWFFNVKSDKWEKLERESIDRENFTITSYTDHFTDMINSTLQLPEGPSPISFNPNSIKELKVANPGVGIPRLDGLKPSQTGDASFNIPLKIPQGRGGATPSLALSYSSELSNGWMGKGFNISTPCISIDTRFGLPEYKGSDTYMHRGEELVFIHNDAKGSLYKPRKSSSFERIYWVRGGSSYDYWEVSDKSGMVYVYGQNEGWIGPNRSNRTKTYTWYLTRIKDPNGNTVEYNYDYENIGVYTYLQSIIYSGYHGVGVTEKGLYRIDFERESRMDRRIDSRGKFPSKLAERLKTVRILYDDNLIRSYVFNYKSNEFGQTQLESYAELDKNDNEFYSYNFEYYSLPVNNAEGGIGYEGFGEETKNWGDPFRNLNTAISGTGGASLTTGVSFFGIAGVTISGGYTYTGGMNTGLMADINGDGLSDYAWTENKQLKTYLNNGAGFDSGFTSFSGLNSNMNVTGQHGTSIGIGANGFGASVSVTGQFSWPSSKTMLSDFNGDGYVDQLERGSSSFKMNNGSSFIPQSLVINNSGSLPAVVPTAEELAEIADLKKSFYREDPLRRWTAPASGTIEVSHEIQALSAEISRDGLDCRTYYKDEFKTIRLSQTGQTKTSTTPDPYSVTGNDKIYLHLDPGVLEIGDDVNWQTTVEYKTIDLMENMDLISALNPKIQINNSLPFPEIAPLYTRHLKEVDDGEDYLYYIIKDNWEDLVNDSLYKQLFLHNMFIPTVVTIDQYLDIRNSLYNSYYDVENPEIFNNRLLPFFQSYEYSVVKKIFIRKPEGDPNLLKAYLSQWSDAEKLRSGGFSWLDGNLIYPDILNTSEIEKNHTVIMDTCLYAADQLLSPGMMDLNGNIFVETIETPEGQMDILYKGSGVNYPEPYVIDETDDSLSFITKLKNFDYTVKLSGKDYAIENISRSAYEGRIKELVLGSTVVGINDFRVLSPALYNEMLSALLADNYAFYNESLLKSSINEISERLYNGMLSGLSAEDLRIYQTFYSENIETGNYEIDSEISDGNRLLVLAKLYGITQSSGSVFNENNELFLMTDSDFTELNNSLQSHSLLWDSFFEKYDDVPNDISYYSIKNDITSENRELLRSILEDLLIVQPFYTENTDTGNFDINRTVTDKGILIVLETLYGLTETSGTVFTASEDLFLLSDSDFSSLDAFLQERSIIWNSYFEIFSDSENGISYFAVKNDLSSTNIDLLIAILEDYLFHVEVFPYFESNGDSYIIKSDITDEVKNIIYDFFSANNIFLWKNMEKKIVYMKGNLLPVDSVIADGDEVYLDIVPGFTTAEAGREIGMVLFPDMDNSGFVSIEELYIPQFDSKSDYNTDNLIDYNILGIGDDFIDLTIDRTLPFYIDPFYGGYRNWSYGIWNGHYEWDETGLINLYQDMADKNYSDYLEYQQKVDEGREDELDESEQKAPLFITADRNYLENKDREKVVEIKLDDETNQTLDSTVIIGPVSSYNKTEIDDSGSSQILNIDFVAYINGDLLHPSRKGGDTFYKIPTTDSSVTGSEDTIPFLNKSKSSAVDISGGYSFTGVGATVGTNIGKSWQYSGLMDLNGDRYPDLISTAMNGSSSARIRLGTGNGFSPVRSFTLPLGKLSQNQNWSIALGGSASASQGTQNYSYKADGKIYSVNVNPGSQSISFSITGSIGASINQIGFSDINGDGLVDQLNRNGLESVNVRMNNGQLGFNSYTWSNPIDLAFWNAGIFDNSYLRSSGLNYSTFSSFGGSLSIGGSAGVVDLGGSYGFNVNSNNTMAQLMDMNGDGLPDHVIKELNTNFFLVRYNLGDTFSSETVKIYRPDWLLSDLTALVVSDLTNLQASGSMSGTSVGGESADRPAGGRLPTSSEYAFSEYGQPFAVDDVISSSKGISISLGASITFKIPIVFVLLTITPGVNGSFGSTSSSLSMMDINGDGLPDHVLKIPGQPLQVKLNNSGKVGLLKEIHLPSGGSYNLNFDRTGNTVDMPQSRYVLSTVTINDGFESSGLDGVHSYSTDYVYENGFYNRQERLFYGFGRVRTIFADLSVQIVSYSNRDYFSRDLVSSVSTEDKNGNILHEKISNYAYNSNYSYAKTLYTPLLISETTSLYETGVPDYIRTTIEYDYDGYGNIIEMRDLGISSDTRDNIYLSIDYKNLSGLIGYQPSLPRILEVYNFNDKLLRRREGHYDLHGNMISLRQFFTNSDSAEYTLDYDNYGNLTLIRGPRGSEISYQYDNQISKYVTGIQNGNSSMGIIPYYSEITWDYALGVDLTTTDINGNIQQKKYDDFGRLIEIRTPYDEGMTPAVSYKYNRTLFPYNAITFNKLNYDENDDKVMRTVVVTDGLGRVLQTAKEGEVYKSGTSRIGWNISGRVNYDNKGRPVEEGQNNFAQGLELPPLTEMIRPIVKEYDNRDRVRIVKLPDSSIMENDFSIKNSRQVMISTDPEGNVTEKYINIRGTIDEIRKIDSLGKILTSSSYRYNIMGELLEVTDFQNNRINFNYDLLGRTLTVNSPDAGYITSSYDLSGNLVKKTDNNLRTNGQTISYEYDGLNRLTKIDYTVMDDTFMVYGEAGRIDYGSGRLLSTTDESGTVSNIYGKLGEIVQVSRTLNRLTSLADTETATMSYKSDYLGRMEEIVYPDGEIVTYDYDFGGQVTSVTGSRQGTDTVYIEKIGYDEFGQRTLIRYGNGTETTYDYDEDRRWLRNLNSIGSFGNEIQNITYDFDSVGNITSLDNDSGKYRATQSYEYDDLYQLTGAEGVYESSPYGSLDYKSTYTQDFTFDSLGNMTNKNSRHFFTPLRSGYGNLNYDYDYEYYDDKPHQAKRIGNMWYLYDSNGNVTEEREGAHSIPADGSGGAGLNSDGDLRWTGYGFGLDRSGTDDNDDVYNRNFSWDEENRLKQSSDTNYTVEYLYDSSGERTVKNSPLGETLYFNSMWQISAETDGNRQSKHIFVGESRIATRLNKEDDMSTGNEIINTYYYHGDHLGSANVVSDYQGDVFEHIEYTPYGEMWVEDSSDSFDKIPFRFTAKEWDEETRLYYMSARYQNPMTSRWMSVDPAGAGLVNPMDGDGNLRGGFNIIESVNWYSYSGNNPINYRDPSGMVIQNIHSRSFQNTAATANSFPGGLPSFHVSQGRYVSNTISRYGCLFTAAVNIGNNERMNSKANSQAWESSFDPSISVESMAMSDRYFGFSRDLYTGTDFYSGSNEITALLKDMTGKDFSADRIWNADAAQSEIERFGGSADNSAYIIGEVKTKNGSKHFINITGWSENGGLEYHDPYQGSSNDYTLEDIRGIYLIQEEQ